MELRDLGLQNQGATNSAEGWEIYGSLVFQGSTEWERNRRGGGESGGASSLLTTNEFECAPKMCYKTPKGRHTVNLFCCDAVPC